MQDVQADGLGRDWPQRQAVRTTLRTTLGCCCLGIHALRDDLLPRKTPIFTGALSALFGRIREDELPSGQLSGQLNVLLYPKSKYYACEDC